MNFKYQLGRRDSRRSIFNNKFWNYFIISPIRLNFYSTYHGNIFLLITKMETSNSTNPIAFNFDKSTIERIVGQQIEQFRFEAMKTCAINKQFTQERLTHQLSEVLNCTVTDEMSNLIVESFYQPAPPRPLDQNVQNFFDHFNTNNQNSGGNHQSTRKYNPRKHNRYRIFKNSGNNGGNGGNQGVRWFQLNQISEEKKAADESLKKMKRRLQIMTSERNILSDRLKALDQDTVVTEDQITKEMKRMGLISTSFSGVIEE